MTGESGKRPLGFVNRRGHASDVSESELSHLSIDTQPEQTITDPPAPHRTKKSRRRSPWSRKKTLVLALIIIVIVAIPVIAGEILRAQYLASANSAKDSLKTIVERDVMPLQKKSDITAAQVATVTEKLEGVRDSMCPGGLLDNMATVYPRAKSAHSECIDQRGRIASLVTQLRDMVGMLRYIESVNATLAPVIAPTTDAFAVIATQQANWQSVSESLAKLDPPTSLKTAHDTLVSAVKSITEGWSKLNVANNARNAADFQAAETQLSDGYGAVRASKAGFATSIADKQASITRLAAQL